MYLLSYFIINSLHYLMGIGFKPYQYSWLLAPTFNFTPKYLAV